MTADPRAPWAEVLRVPAGAAAEDARAAFLRALPDAGFVPPAPRVAAVAALTGGTAPAGADPDVEQLLSEEVEAFAAHYWELAPAERLTAWADLQRRGAPPRRLRELEPGLDVAVVPVPEPTAEELAELFRSLFVLPPRERAIRRNAWLLERAAEPERWRGALAVLLDGAPTVPALDVQLWAALGPDFALAGFVAGATATPTQGSDRTGADARERSPARRRPHAPNRQDGVGESRPAPAESRSGQLGPLNAGTVAVIVLVGVVLLVAALAESGRRPEQNKPPAVTSNTPSKPPAASPSWSRTFGAAEVAAFEQYERDQIAGLNPQTPPGYGLWLRERRPGATSVFPGTVLKSPAKPAPGSAYIGPAEISECEQFVLDSSGPRPKAYDNWVRAGRPTKPGLYQLRDDPP